MKASGTVRRARRGRGPGIAVRIESGAPAGGVGRVAGARSWLGPAAPRAIAPRCSQHGGHCGRRVGEAGAMVPARWGIAGSGEAGSPFQGKGQVARLGRSSHGTSSIF